MGVCPEHFKRHSLPPLSLPLLPLSVSEGAEAQPEPRTVRRAEELTEGGRAELQHEAGNPQLLFISGRARTPTVYLQGVVHKHR